VDKINMGKIAHTPSRCST